MLVEVMAESSFSFKKLLDQWENQELKAPGGIATPAVIYTTISAHPWSETVQPIMEALRDAARRRAFALVSQAYTSIMADDFAAFVGLPVEEAVKGILEQGWQADSTTRMVMPKKPVAGTLDVSFNRFILLSEPAPIPPIPNEQQLAKFTNYVAFLEN
ncbi:hypothetical protein J1605_007002 [Eschrichtius robustus]|uniref:CSN8/PSMD8/EIF3K domain-containing protein n=1 Tax=Eschrichtius robustus TaxID=9764 RepID=A0AB34H3C2_ESCRO|nr:hypothetical protein J1605_007002 [Eschrichtius robustus]